jgi:hypothetical protein
MSPLTVGLMVFASIFGGALLGIFLHSSLPQHHLGADSKDIVKLGMGLVATMSALVLGLLVASAKGSYDTQSTELTRLSANIALLDRVLARYGQETKEPRELLRGFAARILNQMWSEDGALKPPTAAGGEIIYDKVAGLSPKNDMERSLQGHALSITMDVGKARWLMYAQAAASVSTPLLVVLVLWLTVIFMSFGLFAPFNVTVVSSLLISSLSVAGAIFLILENVWALCRSDSGLQRSAARRPRTSRPVKNWHEGKQKLDF